MKTGNLLIADDNRNVLNALSLFLPAEFSHVKVIQHPNRLLEELSAHQYDVVLLDMNFTAGLQTGNEGIYWLREIKSRFPGVEVVMFTAYGDIELAVKALKEGASDFILKPWENEKLLATLRAACRISESSREVTSLKKKGEFLSRALNPEQEILYCSEAMQRIMGLIRKVAPTDADILITGENGTGKELIAREIHRHSNRSESLFVPADLSALTDTLFESELFGHVRGAFTDAREDREGKFLLADGGSLFLDEIGNIPLHLQSKLLTVLQTRCVTPVGSNKTFPLDIRLISATNKPVDQMVQNGSFREDLLYRINTIRIHIPPLRDRKEDIPLLAGHFLNLYAGKYNKAVPKPDESLMEKLRNNSWPGNIRELQHAMEKMVILSENGRPDPDSIPTFSGGLYEEGEPETIDEMEKRMIMRALSKCGNNLSAAANRLGISRPTLYSKMSKYGL